MEAHSAAADPDETTPVAATRAVTKQYTRGQEPGRVRALLGRDSTPPQVTALDSVSMSVADGEIVGLSGPSGSGKSTLLHVLAGLVAPTTGTVAIQGTDLTTLSARERTRLRLQTIGIVFQRFHLIDSLSARANVALPLVELGISRQKRRSRADDLLARVGLRDRAGHRPNELSGGEQQRVAMARALAAEPELLLADEPTGELDTETGQQVLAELEALAADRAVVVASHDQQTLAIADRVINLRDGVIAE